jgi:hypothetical protein
MEIRKQMHQNEFNEHAEKTKESSKELLDLSPELLLTSMIKLQNIYKEFPTSDVTKHFSAILIKLSHAAEEQSKTVINLTKKLIFVTWVLIGITIVLVVFGIPEFFERVSRIVTTNHYSYTSPNENYTKEKANTTVNKMSPIKSQPIAKPDRSNKGINEIYKTK